MEKRVVELLARSLIVQKLILATVRKKSGVAGTALDRSKRGPGAGQVIRYSIIF